MNVKAIERKIAYLGKEGGKDQYMYVMQPLIYNKLTPEKVIQQAALHCGLTPAVMNVAYAALSEVIKAWATEGHSVAIPGLGTMRFGVRAKSVETVTEVASGLITARRVIFTPNVDIKDELQRTAIQITCYDKDGNVIKKVTSGDKGDVEEPDNSPSGGNNPGGGNTQGGGTGNPGSGNTDQGKTDTGGSDGDSADVTI